MLSWKKGASALLAAGALTAPAVALAAGDDHAGTSTGPSSSQSPYVLRSQPGVNVRSLLTVGDSVNAKPDGSPYRLVGIPDGLGAYDNGDGTFTVLMNHELRETVGAVRRHGAKGAFVSKWTVRKSDLAVLHGEDLIEQVATWAGGSYAAPALGVALSRLCSADLADPSAFYDEASGLGYDGRIFTSGEESGTEGRGFAHVVDSGISYQLPALGRFSYENIVAHPGTGERTLVVSTDDSTPGQAYVYTGAKSAGGNAVERAGLADGRTFGIAVTGMTDESRSAADAAERRFTLEPLGDDGDVRALTGAQLQAQSEAAGVTEFLRPEDAAWDPTDRDVLYFVTTDRFDNDAQEGRSRLWKLTFDDVDDPESGGTVEAVLDGTEGQQMLDNIAVNERGQVLLQEDPGGQTYLAKVQIYYPRQDRLVEVAHHDGERFAPGGLTIDEESSGIIDVSEILGDGWYLGDVQAHYAAGDPELVEGGQLFALHVPAGRVYGGKR